MVVLMADNWKITIRPFIQLPKFQFEDILNRHFCFIRYSTHTTLYFRDFKFIIDGIESKVLSQNIRQCDSHWQITGR